MTAHLRLGLSPRQRVAGRVDEWKDRQVAGALRHVSRAPNIAQAPTALFDDMIRPSELLHASIAAKRLMVAASTG